MPGFRGNAPGPGPWDGDHQWEQRFEAALAQSEDAILYGGVKGKLVRCPVCKNHWKFKGRCLLCQRKGWVKLPQKRGRKLGGGIGTAGPWN